MKSLGVLVTVVALMFAASAHAAPINRPQWYGNAFKADYNRESRTNHFPYVISKIKCWPSHAGRQYFACYATTASTQGGHPLCGAIVIDTSFDVLENALVKCAGAKDPVVRPTTY
jgi:hypothetical protein